MLTYHHLQDRYNHCYTDAMIPLNSSSRPTVVFAQLQAFSSLLNPYEDAFLAAFDGNDDEELAYKQDWNARRAHFRTHTGHGRWGVGSLDAWARQWAPALLEAWTPEEQTQAAVWAAGSYQQELLEALVGAQPMLHRSTDANGDTPLHAACGAQNERAIRWLLEHAPRASAPATDNQGRWASERLFLRGANAGPWRPKHGGGDLRLSLAAVFELAPDLVTGSLPAGDTLLHRAAGWPWPRPPCQDLVTFGLTWNRPNAQGQTAADVLAQHPTFRPSAEHSKTRRDARFVAEAVAAGQEPWQPPSALGNFFNRALRRIRRG